MNIFSCILRMRQKNKEATADTDELHFISRGTEMSGKFCHKIYSPKENAWAKTQVKVILVLKLQMRSYLLKGTEGDNPVF